MDTTPAVRSLVRIGSLNAHITGDFRYNDELRVYWDPNTNTVRVRVYGTGAVGGMDSGRSDSYDPSCALDQYTLATPKDAMALIKRVIAKDRFLFKQYGKPTKNFRWHGNVTGLNTKNCAAALAWARETQPQ